MMLMFRFRTDFLWKPGFLLCGLVLGFVCAITRLRARALFHFRCVEETVPCAFNL